MSKYRWLNKEDKDCSSTNFGISLDCKITIIRFRGLEFGLKISSLVKFEEKKQTMNKSIWEDMYIQLLQTIQCPPPVMV